MGCGQSKIHLYPRKSKSKANGKKGGHADSDAETDEDEGHIEDTEKYQNRDREKNEESDDQSNKGSQESDDDVAVSLLRAKNLSLLQSQEISTSQQNFFRMLDKKIDEGPDYDSGSETEIALEEARLNALVQHWESASLTASICSSASWSLQTTPVRQAAPAAKHMTLPRGAMLQSAVAQQVFNADFLPHGTVPPQSSQLPAGPLKLLQQNPNQQMVIAHMNTKMLHQMAVGPQLPMGMSPADIQVSAGTTTANTSNALANQSQQYAQHMLTLPPGATQLMGKPPNISPKRMVDPRLLMNPNPLAQQMQPSMQSQFITASAISPVPPPPSFVNGGRSPQPPGIGMQMPMQMAYFGQPTAQQSMQVTSQHEQQLQQLPPPQSQNQNQPYYGDIIHSIQAPPAEYRFPPAISVQRLAPQVQRQLRETQELIKDSCPQLYAAGYGSPGPPIRNQTRNPTRRPTLETQFSQELS